MKNMAKKYYGEFLFVLMALVFSFEWFFIRKLSFHGFSAIDITFGRASFSFLILFVIFFKSAKHLFKPRNLRKQESKYIIALGLVTVCSGVFFNLAIKLTTVSNTLIILYMSVFWGIIFGVLFLGEKTTIKKVIYTGMAFGGICLAISKGASFSTLSVGIGGLFALIASIFYSADAIISRKIKHTNTFKRMLMIYAVMTVILILFIIIFQGFGHFKLFFSKYFLIYAFALALTCGVMGKGLMYMGINRVAVSVAMVIMLLEPISQIFTAYVFADERITIINIFGMLLVFLMVILISKRKADQEAVVSIEANL